jgi:hypothetical protein
MKYIYLLPMRRIFNMIYAYLNDEVFQNPEITIRNYSSYDLRHGYLPAEQVDYFVEPIALEDNRVSRLFRYNTPMQGEMQLMFDATQAEDEVNTLLDGTSEDRENLFNVLEYVLYRISIASSTSINNDLVANPDTYSKYIPNSLQISDKFEEVHIFDVIDTSFPIVDWVEFGLTIGISEVYIKVWVNNVAFTEQYPISTICEIVPPLSPNLLLDPRNIDGPLSAAIDSSMLSASKLSQKIKTDGYTDYYSYRTKYVDVAGNILHIPFNILYKGKVPLTLDIRQAIKDYLLSLNLATEDEWKIILPDLFVLARFFIVPLWDNITTRPTRNIFPSVVSCSRIYEVIDKLLLDVEEDTRHTKIEILDLAYSEILLAACPDHLNQKQITIREAHPTYQRYSPNDVEYQYQETITKLFTTYLNRAVAVASGITTDDIFTTNTYGTRTYITFVVDEVEYLIMTKSSYEISMNEE